MQKKTREKGGPNPGSQTQDSHTTSGYRVWNQSARIVHHLRCNDQAVSVNRCVSFVDERDHYTCVLVARDRVSFLATSIVVWIEHGVLIRDAERYIRASDSHIW